MLKASFIGMNIFMGIPLLSRLINKNCMNGILSNLSDHSYTDISHALQIIMVREPWKAECPETSLLGVENGSPGGALVSVGGRGCSGYLPCGVSLIRAFGPGFCASTSQAESSLPTERAFQFLCAFSEMAASDGSYAKGV